MANDQKTTKSTEAPAEAPAVPAGVTDILQAMKDSLEALRKAKSDSMACRVRVLDSLSVWEKTMPAEIKPVLGRSMTGLRSLMRVGQTDLGPWQQLLVDLQSAVTALPAIEAAVAPVIADLLVIIRQGV